MTTWLPILALLTPLATALSILAVAGLEKSARRTVKAISVAGALALLGVGLWMLWTVWHGSPLVVRIGGWSVPLGIVFVTDVYSAGMVTYTGLVTAIAVPYSLGRIADTPQAVQYHAVFHLMVFGAVGAFQTGDLFNLFVWFEVLLIASYVLVAYHGTAHGTSSAFRYVAVNLVGGALMLVGIALLYGALGTLNMADLGARAAQADPVVLVGPAAFLLAAFLTKAGAFPFHHWVPAAYDAAPAPVAAFLASVSKNVGVYALVRVFLTVFDPGGTYELLQPAILAMTGTGIVYGGYMAYTQQRVDQVLSYHAISQVGLILVGFGIGGPLGLLATVVYGPNHGLIQGLLFLSSGNVRNQVGTDHIAELGGVAQDLPLTSTGFLVGALALIGMPPMNGFFSKFIILDASVHAPTWAWFAVAAFVGGIFFTVASLTKVWTRVFWGKRQIPSVEASKPTLVAVVGLAAVLVAIGVFFEAYVGVAEAALSNIPETAAYVLEVAR